MQRTGTKIIAAIFLASFLLWLGILTVRIFVGVQLIDGRTLQYKKSIDPVVERAVYSTLADYSTAAMAVYPLVLITGFLYVRVTRKNLRKSGWLLMSAILFCIFIPVELYCFTIDWSMIGMVSGGQLPIESYRTIFMKRAMALAGLPFIAWLCYYTILGLVLVRPFEINDKTA